MRATRLWLPIVPLPACLQGIFSFLFNQKSNVSYFSRRFWGSFLHGCPYGSTLAGSTYCTTDKQLILIYWKLYQSFDFFLSPTFPCSNCRFIVKCRCHLPALCIGMEYLRTNNLNLAEQVRLYYCNIRVFIWLLRWGLYTLVTQFPNTPIGREMTPCWLLQFFLQARSICSTDPLVYNELGVLAYRNRE